MSSLAAIALMVGMHGVTGADAVPALAAWSVGALEVRSIHPGATVRVDGETRGRTPLRVAGLSVGSHEVEVVTRGAVESRTVSVLKGVTVKLDLSRPRNLQLSQADAAGVFRAEGVKTLVSILAWPPWGFGLAVMAGLSALSAGVLWTSNPEHFPGVGQLPWAVSPGVYQVLRWSAVGGAVVLSVLTAGALLGGWAVRAWTRETP